MFVPQFSALLSGLFAGWQRRGVAKIPSADFAAIADRWAASGATGFEAALTDLISLYQLPFPAALQKSFDTARKVVADPEAAMEARIAAIGLISRDTSDATFELLISLLSAPEPTAIQQSAVVAIGKSGRADAGSRLLDVWSQTLPGVRGSLIGLLLSRREHQEALLTALENGTVDFSELNLDLEQRRRLLRHSTREISKRSAKFFSDEEYSNRKSIVGEWLTRLPAQGDPTVGREVFTNKCATCHVIGGAGNRVGPDLQAMSHRSVEDLLSHILDPNMSINPNYVSCVLETVDGQILNGLLAEETADSVTLRQAEGKTQTIERAEIQQLKTLKTSLMPEGLEKELTPAQMRSLIAYLQEF
jgi:putative heme-binding domain-containing protein